MLLKPLLTILISRLPRLNAATNKTTKKISHTRRSPKDRNYPSTPFDKLQITTAILKLSKTKISN
ncbi:hypothetical protein EFM27_13685 [Lactiplantibacillus plantarum]|nr:hypothetical protein [Lactiplantibacillus plantarum]